MYEMIAEVDMFGVVGYNIQLCHGDGTVTVGEEGEWFGKRLSVWQKSLIQSASLEAWVIAMYSALADESATAFCLELDQDIRPENI